MNIIYYETGANQTAPLFSYEGCSYEEAHNIIKSKFNFKRFDLYTQEKVAKLKEFVDSWHNNQWYICPWSNVITGEYINKY